MDILLVDSTQYSPTTPLFADCLGSDDVFFDEAPYLSSLNTSCVHKALYRLFGRPIMARAMNKAILTTARRQQPDVVLIVKGMFIRPETLQRIKTETGATLVNFSTDDPWNPKTSSRDILAAIPEYDLYCSVRKAAIPDIHRAGCPRVEHVLCGFHPHLHFPPPVPVAPTVDVTVVGGADEDRVPYVRTLVRELVPDGVKVALLGGYWDRDPEFRPYAKGIVTGKAYRNALWRSKIAVCLVRRANRDDHKMASIELPACGVFTLFEDTPTHRELFPGSVCFSSPEGLVDSIRYFLSHDVNRQRIARTHRRLVWMKPHTWGHRFQQILGVVREIRWETQNTGDRDVAVP